MFEIIDHLVMAVFWLSIALMCVLVVKDMYYSYKEGGVDKESNSDYGEPDEPITWPHSRICWVKSVNGEEKAEQDFFPYLTLTPVHEGFGGGGGSCTQVESVHVYGGGGHNNMDKHYTETEKRYGQ